MILGLLIIVFIVPSLVLGAILMFLFPHLPMAVHITLILLSVGGTACYIVWKRTMEYRAQARNFTVPGGKRPIITRKRYLAVFLIATIMGAILSFALNKATLYIDNGTERQITFVVNGDPITVEPGGDAHMQIVRGTNNLRYENTQRKLDVSSGGDWVFNVEMLNEYWVTTVLYGRSNILSRNDWRDRTDQESQQPDVDIKEEFFHSPADYVFEAPNSISVKRKLIGNKEVQKTVLFKIRHYNRAHATDTTGVSDKADPEITEEEQ